MLSLENQHVCYFISKSYQDCSQIPYRQRSPLSIVPYVCVSEKEKYETQWQKKILAWRYAMWYVWGREKDLKLFLLWCPAYEEERRQNFCLQQPYVEEEELTMRKLLFDKENIQEAKVTIMQLWKIRETKRKEIENRPFAVRDTFGSSVTKTTLPTLNWIECM